MRSYLQKTAEAKHDWYIVDASGQRLGTLAVRIARALSGKHKATWTPHIDDGDHVVVINADKIELGGKKWDTKVYYRHSGFPGGLKIETARQVKDKHPERRLNFEAARKTAVAVVHFSVPLLAAEFDFVGVDDDDMVSIVNVGRPSRFVLAGEGPRDAHGQSSEALTARIDDVPIVFCFGGLL